MIVDVSGKPRLDLEKKHRRGIYAPSLSGPSRFAKHRETKLLGNKFLRATTSLPGEREWLTHDGRWLMNLGPWQGLASFDGTGTFLVRLGAGTGRVRWLAWTPSRRLVGEAIGETEAHHDANEALAMLQAIDRAGMN